jgi:hypothetical protein
MSSATLICCVESGYLEAQTIELLRSIQMFAQSSHSFDIRAYSPRVGHHPRATTIATLRRLGAVWIDEPLNHALAHYPISNKLYALEHAEQNSPRETIVFLDSDKFVLKPIHHESLPETKAMALRPVNRKGPGSTGPIDPNDDYWRSLVTDFGLSDAARVETVADGESIRPYFNAGFVQVRAAACVGAMWLANLHCLLATTRVPMGNTRCMDQIALAVTAQSPDNYRVLPATFNVPLPFVDAMASRSTLPVAADVVSVHHFGRTATRPIAEWIPKLGGFSIFGK